MSKKRITNYFVTTDLDLIRRLSETKKIVIAYDNTQFITLLDENTGTRYSCTLEDFSLAEELLD